MYYVLLFRLSEISFEFPQNTSAPDWRRSFVSVVVLESNEESTKAPDVLLTRITSRSKGARRNIYGTRINIMQYNAMYQTQRDELSYSFKINLTNPSTGQGHAVNRNDIVKS